MGASGARVEMVRALADVPAETWDAAVRPGHAALLHAFLSPCDAALEQASWRAFTVRRAEGAISAVSPGLVHTVDLSGAATGAARRAIETARRLVEGAFRARVLELGPPVCPGAPVACADPATAAEDTKSIVAAAWRDVVAAGEADALMVRELAGANRGPIEQGLEALGFAVATERPTFILALGGGTFEDYLAAMRAPYRRRAERYLRADFRVSVTSDFAGRADAIARLFEITTSRAKESRRERTDAGVVRAWSRCARARAVLLEAPARGLELAALVLEDPPVLHFVRVGFDADVGRSTGAYPRLLYELVRLAVDRGCSYLDFGLTSADPKLRAGAQALPLRVWVRHRNPAMQAVLRAARRFVPHSEAAPDRHVFRDPLAAIHPFWYGGGVWV
jgi:hypothetical protein